MLQLEDIRIDIGGFHLAADLTIAEGAKVPVIGPSGAGKSTLLSLIAGFLKPDAGRVLWNGQDITRNDPGDRPLSIVFQDNNLFPHLTVAQNVGLGLSPALRLDPAQHARIEDSLARVGLAGFGPRKPAQLSGGQQSRTALARVLIRAQPLMLLDEPFAALGPAMKAEMLDLVTEVADTTGAAVLIVTHDPKDALRLGGQTILVADGVAQAPQDTGSIFEDPPEALRAYLE